MYKTTVNKLLDDRDVSKLFYTYREVERLFVGIPCTSFKVRKGDDLMPDSKLHMSEYSSSDWSSISRRLPDSSLHVSK